MTAKKGLVGYRRKKGAHKAHAASRVVPNKAQRRGRASSAMVDREDDAEMGGDDDVETDDNKGSGAGNGDNASDDDSEYENEWSFFSNRDLRLIPVRGAKMNAPLGVRIHNMNVPILHLPTKKSSGCALSSSRRSGRRLRPKRRPLISKMSSSAPKKWQLHMQLSRRRRIWTYKKKNYEVPWSSV